MIFDRRDITTAQLLALPLNWSLIVDDVFKDDYTCAKLIDEIKAINVTDVFYWNSDGDDYFYSYLLIYRADGKFYIASDSHCSCYGYETFTPEDFETKELFIEVLNKMKPLFHSYLIDGDMLNDLIDKVKVL